MTNEEVMEEIKEELEENLNIGLYEKRAGGERVFVRNIYRSDMFGLPDLNQFNEPYIGGPRF